MYYDWTYILVIIGAVLSMLAQAKVKSAFARYSKVGSRSGMTAAQAAEQILWRSGLSNVTIRRVPGDLTDNYSPNERVLHLSDSTIYSNSIAAIGVAAHECGHALQHAEGYGPLALRSALVPVTNFGQKIAWPLILIGLLINNEIASILLYIGVIAFSLAVVFSIVTLPVEFNASNRAIKILRSSGMMDEQELRGVKAVLTAAALTYVAGAAAAILSLLRILIIAGGRRRD